MGTCRLLEKTGQTLFKGSFAANQRGLAGSVTSQIAFISLKEFYPNVRETLLKKPVWPRQSGFWWCTVKRHPARTCLFKTQWKIKMRNPCSEFKTAKMQLNTISSVTMVKTPKDHDNPRTGKRTNEALSPRWNLLVSGSFLSRWLESMLQITKVKTTIFT